MPLASLSLTTKEEERARPHAVLPASDYPLNLQLEEPRGGSHWLWVLAASLLVHMLFLFVGAELPHLRAPSATLERRVVHRVPLYLPRDILTQKAPNTREITKHIDLEALQALQNQQRQSPSPARSIKQFEMPKVKAVVQPTKNAQILPEAPSVTITQTAAAALPQGAANGLAMAPPPAPPPSAGPFQNIGSEAPPVAHPTLTPPRATVQAAISGMTQSGSGSHVVISDDSPTDARRPMPGTMGQLGAQHAGVELKSDPEGVDMKPYLARILTIVRANWRRVIPESARMGTLRGRTVVEFIINRDGSIPKLVTSESSGLDPLDRAAIAGLSMSNPLPPLPPEYKGMQVRLAFSFAYNMAAE
jgi:TonB family protein